MRPLTVDGWRGRIQHARGSPPGAGGMAEWTMAMVLKTIVAARSPGVRIPLPPPGKSHSNTWGGARVADWGRLLSGCGVKSSTQGSNPCLPAFLPRTL